MEYNIDFAVLNLKFVVSYIRGDETKAIEHTRLSELSMSMHRSGRGLIVKGALKKSNTAM